MKRPFQIAQYRRHAQRCVSAAVRCGSWRVVALLGTILAAAEPVVQPLGAQRARHVAIGIGLRHHAPEPESQARTTRVAGSAAGRAGGDVGRHVLVGALAGAAMATVAAYMITHQSRVTDHSEDGLAYIIFVPAGTLAGGIVGGIVGLLRSR